MDILKLSFQRGCIIVLSGLHKWYSLGNLDLNGTLMKVLPANDTRSLWKCSTSIGCPSHLRFLCFFFFVPQQLCPTMFYCCNGLTVLIVLAINWDSDLNRRCDVAALFCIFLLTNKLQNLFRFRWPIVLLCMWCITWCVSRTVSAKVVVQ